MRKIERNSLIWIGCLFLVLIGYVANAQGVTTVENTPDITLKDALMTLLVSVLGWVANRFDFIEKIGIGKIAGVLAGVAVLAIGGSVLNFASIWEVVGTYFPAATAIYAFFAGIAKKL